MQQILGAQSECNLLSAAVYVEVLAEMDRAVRLLCLAIGINSVTLANGVTEILLDGALLSALVQTSKGKKLLAKSISFLNPAQRWAIIPVILSKVLLIDPATQAADDCLVEQRLIALIVEVPRYRPRIHPSHHLHLSIPFAPPDAWEC